MKRCTNPKCGAINPDDARFCRTCGTKFVDLVGNYDELQRKSNFVPTSLTKWKEPKLQTFFYKVYVFLAVISLIICIYCLIYSFYDGDLNRIINGESSIDGFDLVIMSGSFICFVLFCYWARYYKNRYMLKNNIPDLSSIADYIQEYKYLGFSSDGIYPLFVKNHKIGVIDAKRFDVQIPAKFDNLEWKEKNRILIATIGDERFYVDIYGNKLK